MVLTLAKDSQAALTKFNSLDKFTISSKPVLLSFVHSGVFVPVINYTSAMERFTFSPLTNRSMKLAYWDEEAYVSELMLAPEEIKSAFKLNEENSSAGKVQGAAVAEKEGILKATRQADGKAKKRKAEESTAASNKKACSHVPL